MEEEKGLEIGSIFSAVEDPRIELTKQHRLGDILLIAVCGVICGARGMGRDRRVRKSKRSLVSIVARITQWDSFARYLWRECLLALTPNNLKRVFCDFVQSLSAEIKGVIAVDGKTLRRSHERANGKHALHMVSAWAADNRMVLAQLATQEKSNEITAIPALLRHLALAGCIVTIDAMGTQTQIASQIIEQEGDYALALKENQGMMYEGVSETFALALKDQFAHIQHESHRTVEKGHGRIEIREYWTITEQEILAYLDAEKRWKELQGIGMVRAERRIGQEVTQETRYYLLSFTGVKTFAYAVRSHWGIENSMHWVLEMAFREDESHIREGHAQENLAVLRHLTLNLLRHEKTAHVGIKVKRLKTAWDTNYLQHVLEVIM